mgnify:CR=1 FL=1
MSATRNRPVHTGSGDDLVPVFCCALFVFLCFLSGCVRPAPQPDTSSPRLVSTAPNLTECVFAVGAGDLLVGRTESCNYPPEVRQIPSVGGFGTPYLEPLLAARPTHVLETVLADPDLRHRLEALHIPVVHVSCTHLDDIPQALLQIGGLTGHAKAAERVADALRTGIAQARADAASRTAHPRVLLLFSADSPVTSGRRAFVSELLELAGGVNVGSETETDYYHFSLEWLLKQDPDIVLCLFEAAGRNPVALFENQTGWKALSAVRQHRVYAVPDLDTASRPGPRLLEGLAQLKRILELDARRTGKP